MNLQEIKTAVESGRRVFWQNLGYEVIKGQHEWLIYCLINGSCIGLTWTDGVTLNGRPGDFFIPEA